MIVQGSGTLTATGSEQTLADLTSALTYVATIDLSNMQAGDTTSIRIYVKVLSGGTLKELYFFQTFDAQTEGNAVVITLPVPSPYEWKITLQQSAGVNRNYDWNVVSL